jgi:hypothetical protein
MDFYQAFLSSNQQPYILSNGATIETLRHNEVYSIRIDDTQKDHSTYKALVWDSTRQDFYNPVTHVWLRDQITAVHSVHVTV